MKNTLITILPVMSEHDDEYIFNILKLLATAKTNMLRSKEYICIHCII